MDIRKIEYFLKVAETKNFNTAARELHISHQALSKQIQTLETEIGAKLLERSTTNVVVTEIGREMEALYRPVLRDWELAANKLQALIDVRNNVLRIGYFSGNSYSRVVEPVLKHLTKQNPDLKYSLLGTDLELLKELMEKDAIDLAITNGIHRQEWKGVKSIVLRTDPLCIIVSDRHPWYGRTQVTTDDLKEADFLVYANGRPLEGKGAFFEELPVRSREATYNLDTYMGILRRGTHFGIIGPTYSRREGNFALIELPEPYRKTHSIMAMYKPLHPQQKLFRTLEELKLD